MSSPTTCADTRSATSSLVSAAGVWRYVLPDGRTVDEFGLAHALASLSARQVKAMGLTMSGISGRPGSISSKSADLSTSLASRLQQRLASAGSTLFRQTWKVKATASGLRFWAHTAAVPRTSDSGCGAWPTPVVQDIASSARTTTAAQKWKSDHRQAEAHTLLDAARLASYPTPCASDNRDRGGWHDPAIQRRMQIGKSIELSMLAEAIGMEPSPSPAPTAKRGSLNPALSRWLMG